MISREEHFKFMETSETYAILDRIKYLFETVNQITVYKEVERMIDCVITNREPLSGRLK